jgi:hypothetical protein
MNPFPNFAASHSAMTLSRTLQPAEIRRQIAPHAGVARVPLDEKSGSRGTSG